MPKWNIDRALKSLEPESCPGTTVQRVLLDVKLLLDSSYKVRYGSIVPTAAEIDRGHLWVWCLSLGFAYAPKACFYGRTIRSAYLKARKAAKDGQLATFTPWGRQDFDPPKRAAKKMDRNAKRAPRSRTATPPTQPG
jgi:hypothetical protein